MKKHLLLFVFALAASALLAQNTDTYSIMLHDMEYDFSLQGFMQQRDGDFIINTYLLEEIGNSDYISLGYMLYKLSPTTLTITDSLFIADTTLCPTFFFAPNPHGEGNIRTNFEYHEECDSIFLRVSHFYDNDFYINSNEDVLIPVCKERADFIIGDCVVDQGDLIMHYYKERPNSFNDYENYIARFDPNGMLKQQALLTPTFRAVTPTLRVLKESPVQYYRIGRIVDNSVDLAVLVVDSLFQNNIIILNHKLKEEVIDPYHIAYEYFMVNGDTEMIPIGGDNVLVAAQYESGIHPQSSAEYGVVVAKYDIRTMVLKGYTVFNDNPGDYKRGECLGLKMMSDGTVYFLYKEEGYPEESFVAVKMDTDLNVEWKRFFKTGDIVIAPWLHYPTLYKDEQGEEKGIAWIGIGTKSGNDDYGLLYFCLNHDGTVGTNEGGIEVRPYAFYPNPAKEQLHIQFSPDVQPAQVELYDLQGRLVRAQNKAFESIDMSQLPTGTYTIRVILEDGKVYSDKVIKE